MKSLEDDLSLSAKKTSELEEGIQMLQHRLDLKEEIEVEGHLIDVLKQELSTVQSQNGDLLLKIVELEENEQVQHEKWKVIEEEESNQKQNLREKIKMLELLNQELKCKIQEREKEFVSLSAGQSLALELSVSDSSQNLESSFEILKETISDLSENKQMKEDENSEFEMLEGMFVRCCEDHKTLRQTVAQMEEKEKQLRSKLTHYESSEVTEDEIHGKLCTKEDSQDNPELIERVVELEQLVANLTQELNDTNKELSEARKATNNVDTQRDSHYKQLNYGNGTTQLMDSYDPFSKAENRTVTGLFERSKYLESENQVLCDKLSCFLSMESQVKQLSDKVKLLENSEDKLMERVIELEEEEEQLKILLAKSKNQSSSVKSDMILTIEEKELEIEQLQEENSLIRQKLCECTAEDGRSESKSGNHQIQEKLPNMNHKAEKSNKLRSVKDNQVNDTYSNDLEKELLSTQEKLEEVQTDYELELSDMEEYNEKLRKQLKILKIKNEELDEENAILRKSNEELCSGPEFLKDLESELLAKQQQLMTRTEEFESKIHFLESHFQNIEAKEDKNNSEEKSSLEIQNSTEEKFAQMGEDPEIEYGEMENTECSLENLRNDNVEIKTNNQGTETGNSNLQNNGKPSKSESEKNSIFNLEELLSELKNNLDESSFEKSDSKKKLIELCQGLETLKSKLCITDNQNKSCQVNESEINSDMGSHFKLELAETVSLLEQNRNEKEQQILMLSNKVKTFQSAVDDITAVINGQQSSTPNAVHNLTQIEVRHLVLSLFHSLLSHGGMLFSCLIKAFYCTTSIASWYINLLECGSSEV